MKKAVFEGFEIEMPEEAVAACYHSGSCDPDVLHWTQRIERPLECSKEALAAVLKEYGAWEDSELQDDSTNWERILWLAAGQIQDEAHELPDSCCGGITQASLQEAFEVLANMPSALDLQAAEGPYSLIYEDEDD